MDFLTTEVTIYKTGCLVNFLPCMAIYIWSRPESLWSDSLTIFYHVYDRSSEIECKILLLFESTLCQCDSWGPLSQPGLYFYGNVYEVYDMVVLFVIYRLSSQQSSLGSDIIGFYHGLVPVRCQVIIRTNAARSYVTELHASFSLSDLAICTSQ